MASHALKPPSRGLHLPAALGSSDDALRRRAADGEAAAFAKLYERHYQALYRYCRSIVRQEQDAQDALANTMLRAWEALQGEERDVPVRPWLFRIAHNESISLLRKRRPTEELDSARALEGLAVEEQAATRMELAGLVSDLGELPDRQRSALVLRELCGFSHEEIAAIHGGSAASAKQTIFAAREGLHDFAEGRDMDCESVKRLLSDNDRRKHRGRRVRAHLRACSDCGNFQAELRQRPEVLASLTPALPAASASALFAGVLSHAGQGGLAAGAAAGPVAAGAGAVLAKVAVGAAILSTAGVGAVEVARVSGRAEKASAAASSQTAASGIAVEAQRGGLGVQPGAQSPGHEGNSTASGRGRGRRPNREAKRHSPGPTRSAAPADTRENNGLGLAKGRQATRHSKKALSRALARLKKPAPVRAPKQPGKPPVATKPKATPQKQPGGHRKRTHVSPAPEKGRPSP